VTKRIVLTCWGSHGDLFPYIGLALALKARGHTPVVATLSLYQQNVESEGLEFAAVGPLVDPLDRNLIARLMDPVRGSEILVRELLMSQLERTYEELARAVAGADLLVSHPVAYAGPIVAERERLPWLSTVLAPMLFFSRHDPPVLPPMPRVNDLPLIGEWLAARMIPFVRRATRSWAEPVYRLRARLGLPRGADPIFEGQFSPHGTLGLFSQVLAEPQPDWPPHVTTTGSVFYNESDPLTPELMEFLAAGEPPVVFTLGTSAVGAAGRFYHESVAAVRKLGVRAVLLTGGFAQNRPDDLPPGVLLVDRAPHQLLFPRASAVVHQVGAGTTAQALRSGQSMLLVPHGHDQFDNARRVRKLGVARTVFPREYRAERVARELGPLLGDARYRERAAATAAVVRREGGADAAAASIEKLLGALPDRRPLANLNHGSEGS
jgi:UDP:flavonoid glycosyltransferase YjiC (YdhE family)